MSMHRVQLTTLQIPQVLLDGNPVVFPYKKTEALFYYIAIEKSATRDMVSTLLWENSMTETARKNLRHALYIIKKTFGFDVITSSQKSILSLHPDIEFYCDVDDFLENNTVNVYHGEFLEGFSLKKSTLYEEWVERKREHIQNLYLLKLYNYIISLSPQNLTEIELRYSQYIEIDPFDERISIALIKAYQANKLYLKGIKVYQKLHNDLGNELGIVPGQEITDLYRKLRIEWAETSSLESAEESHIIKGRTKEAARLKGIYQLFLNGAVHAVMVSGENGVGKTYLVQNLIESIREDHVLQFNAACFSAEQNTPLYPWNTLIFQLEEYITKNKLLLPQAYIQAVAQFFPTFLNQPIETPNIPLDIDNSFNFRAVQNGIFRILSQITENTGALLIIENFHFSDSLSRQILKMLLRELHQNFMVIFTCLDTLDRDMHAFTSSLKKDHLLTDIHLNRFSKEDMNEIITATLENQKIDQITLDSIYEETAGNAFFLHELLTAYKDQGTLSGLSPDAQSILSERLNGLSIESKQILDIISLFHDYATLPLLETILDHNSLDILEYIEELKIRSLIQERHAQGNIQFLFTHNKMREFVNSNVSPAKKKVLHNSIGYALERILSKNEPNYYAQLVYHFSRGENSTKVITYQIYPFEDISITMFELYPSLFYSLDPIKTENLSSYFVTLENNLENIHEEFTDENQYQDLYARLLIAKGRYSILTGLYCDGLNSIKKSLQLPYVQNNPAYMLKSLRQMVYYSIQLYQVDMMKEYVEKGLDLAKNEDHWLELALFFRLNGLRHMMLNQYEECRVHLEQSIHLLETHIVKNGTSIVNIAAAFNYLGEMERKQKHFNEAIQHYQHAISLCTEYNVSINATFYTNLGCAYTGKKNKVEAYKSFFTASDLYDNSYTLMGRSIAKGYCAVFYSEKGNFEKAKKYLSDAEKAVKQLGSPLEKGLFRRTQAELYYRFSKEMQEILTEDLAFYCEDCERLLKPFSVYEMDDIDRYQKS